MDKPRRVAILGSTGSIGTSALDVIASRPGQLELAGVSAHRSVDAMVAQVGRYAPAMAVMVDEGAARELARRCPETRVASGLGGLVELVTRPDVDTVLIGSAGVDALIPLCRAIDAGKRIALASKELLVMAGGLIMDAVRQAGVTLVPVDSEHSALFQLLRGIESSDVARLILTGSGGSLWARDPALDGTAALEDVLRHPKWSMGRKITVDSATLMNKGLELIEAHWLFGVPYDRIDIVIHPQAVVHALVELTDGSCLAHLGACDMRLPIQYALSFPDRWPAPGPRMQLTELAGLAFHTPDLARFTCLALAWQAARTGGTACAVLSAANEVAVEAFLRGALPFGAIGGVIRDALDDHRPVPQPSLDQILASDRWARQRAEVAVQARASGIQGFAPSLVAPEPPVAVRNPESILH